MMEDNMANHKHWIFQTLGILLGILLILLIVDKFHTVAQNLKSNVPKNTISMTAQGKVEAKPDLATVNVGVLTNAATAKAAQDENTKQANKIIDFVKKQGIDSKDIATSNFSVYPNYDYTSGRNEITGYQANQNLTIKIRGVDKSTDTLNKILGGAVDSGSNQIQGVSFGFDDPDNLRQEARKQAIEKAKQKAEELAQITGIRLGKIVSVSDNSNSFPYPMPYALEGKAAGGGAVSVTPDVEPGSQDITADITLVFEIK